MKRKTVIKLKNAGLLLCLGMSVLTGCKNTTVDYDIDGVTESKSIQRINQDGETGLKQFADESRWSEEWMAENEDGEEYQCEVNVDISIPDEEQMYAIEVEESSFDEDEKERIAGKIFGTEEIYYNDIAHLPKKEVTERYNSYLRISSFWAAEVETIREERLSQCGEAMETAGDVYIPVRKYDVNEYLGKREGISYELSFGEDNTALELYVKYMGNSLTYSEQIDFLESRNRNVYLAPKDIYQICPQEVSEVEDLYYIAGDRITAGEVNPVNENQCGLSEEEAQKLAQSFAESLGMDYSVYAGSSPLWWFNGFKDSKITYFTDGYVFYYDAGVENLSFVQYGTQGNYRDIEKREKEENQYSLKSRMEVYVSENGIIGMKAHNPIEIIDVSKEVKLLPLETVKEIIKEYSNQNKLLISKEYLGVNELKLIYFRVRDKENPGYYSYIPTWRLSHGYEYDEKLNAASIDTVILINAMDGSVIDLSDEI